MLKFFLSIYSLLGIVLLILSLMIYAFGLTCFVFLRRSFSTQTTMIRGWNLSVLKIYGIRVQVEGGEHHNPDVSSIIVSNHQSNMDIPAAFAALGGNIRMLAKKELFKIPLFGWCLKIGSFVEIDRGDRRSALQAVEKIRALVKEGIHIWIAPEGTRSEHGQLLAFKKGAFNIAIDTGLPLQPIVMLNCYEINPKGSFFVRPLSTLKVKVLPRIYPQPGENSDQLMQRCRMEFEKTLKEYKA